MKDVAIWGVGGKYHGFDFGGDCGEWAIASVRTSVSDYRRVKAVRLSLDKEATFPTTNTRPSRKDPAHPVLRAQTVTTKLKRGMRAGDGKVCARATVVSKPNPAVPSVQETHYSKVWKSRPITVCISGSKPVNSIKFKNPYA
jgi:hypothetical protein